MYLYARGISHLSPLHARGTLSTNLSRQLFHCEFQNTTPLQRFRNPVQLGDRHPFSANRDHKQFKKSKQKSKSISDPLFTKIFELIIIENFRFLNLDKKRPSGF